MFESDERILLAHGGGGVLTRRLIEEMILPALDNPFLRSLQDSAVLPRVGERLAFTTDSFVVKPLFFRGGDIGRLAVCGTVNDLAVMGAKPAYMAISFVIEEGLPLSVLRRVVSSIAETAREVGVHVVTGDTKVVERGAADGLFLTSTGIGLVPEGVHLAPEQIKPGDQIIVSGPLGDHGIAVMSEREGIRFETSIKSDVAPLNELVAGILENPEGVRCMRDPTRGGAAAALNELAAAGRVGMLLREASIPVREGVRQACEMLGFDPLYVANEGKLILICAADAAGRVLARMRAHPLGAEAEMIGEITSGPAGRVILETSIGGRRIVEMPYGEELPRIC